jgi:hypothetical protein
MNVIKKFFQRLVICISYILFIPLFIVVSFYVFILANPFKIIFTGHVYSFNWEDVDVFSENSLDNNNK